MCRARRDAVTGEGASRAVAQMAGVARDSLAKPGRIRSGPQHSFVVIRLEHEDIGFAAECSNILIGVANVVTDAGARSG